MIGKKNPTILDKNIWSKSTQNLFIWFKSRWLLIKNISGGVTTLFVNKVQNRGWTIVPGAGKVVPTGRLLHKAAEQSTTCQLSKSKLLCDIKIPWLIILCWNIYMCEEDELIWMSFSAQNKFFWLSEIIAILNPIIIFKIMATIE